MVNKQPRQTWLLIAILVALLMRLGLLGIAFAHPERTLMTDSGSYTIPAQALLENGYYAQPDGMRMPLYPAFIALVTLLFGDSPVAIVILQVLFGLGTVYLTYRSGLLLGISQAASAVGAMVLALSLESLISPFFVLTDTLFTFLLVAATYTLLCFIKDNRPIWLVSTSLLTGMLTLCRPVMIFGALTLLILLVFNKGRRFLQRLSHALIYTFLLIALFIAPWMYRNAQVTGFWTLTTEMDLYWIWGAATVQADIEDISVDQAKVNLDAQVETALVEQNLEPSEENWHAVSGEIAKQILRQHPVNFVLQTLRFDLRNFLPGMGYAVNYLGLSQGNTEGMELLETQGAQGVINNYFSGRLLSGLIFMPFMILLAAALGGAVIGTVLLLKKRDWFALAVLLLPTIYMLGVPGYSSNSRYRVPVMPLIALLAGMGLVAGWHFIQPRLARMRNRKK